MRDLAFELRDCGIPFQTFDWRRDGAVPPEDTTGILTPRNEFRSRRFDRAEKLAAEAPVKMLGPLMLCIFPAVFIILLGPVLSQSMKGFFQ